MAEANSARNEAVARETGEGRFQVRISAGGAQFLGDEPIDVGGMGSGPSPYQLLASALASCTTMTLRLYAARKGWPVRDIRTAVGHHREGETQPADVFVRRISFGGSLDEEQRQRLLEIADKCPVHRTLEAGVRVETRMGEHVPVAAPARQHEDDMEALISVGRHFPEG